MYRENERAKKGTKPKTEPQYLKDFKKYVQDAVEEFKRQVIYECQDTVKVV